MGVFKIMCCKERKTPARIICFLSTVIFFCAVGMIVLSFKFNNDGLSTDLGSAGQYANMAFYILITAAALALIVSLCGCIACKSPKRKLAVCFGCMLLPASILMLGFGVVITGVSSTKEEELRDYCNSYEELGYEGVSKKDQVLLSVRETINDVDETVGSFVSKSMCSYLCPCDLDLTNDENGSKDAWLDVLSDQATLDKFDRCRTIDLDCPEEKQIIYFTSNEELAAFKLLTGFEIQSYSSFADCFNDLRSGNRDTSQISEEKVKEY